MKVQTITNSMYLNKTYKNNNSKAVKNTAIQNNIIYKNPTFGNYTNNFERILKQEITHFDEVEKVFLELFNSAKKMPGAQISSDVEFLSKSLAVRSVYNLFFGLSNYKMHQQRERMKKFVTKGLDDNINLINDEHGNAIVKYCTTGLRFIDAFREDLENQAPQIIFTNPNKPGQIINFTLDKDRDLCIDRMRDIEYGRNISYYLLGGMKRDNKYKLFVSNEATYYNRDGSKCFWKNLIGV